MLKDSFWKRALNNPLDAGPVFEFLGFESTGSGPPLSNQVYRTLFRDNDDNEGCVIGPRSILRMQVKRVLFCDIRFESKAQNQKVTWADYR